MFFSFLFGIWLDFHFVTALTEWLGDGFVIGWRLGRVFLVAFDSGQRGVGVSIWSGLDRDMAGGSALVLREKGDRVW